MTTVSPYTPLFRSLAAEGAAHFHRGALPAQFAHHRLQLDLRLPRQELEQRAVAAVRPRLRGADPGPFVEDLARARQPRIRRVEALHHHGRQRARQAGQALPREESAERDIPAFELSPGHRLRVREHVDRLQAAVARQELCARGVDRSDAGLFHKRVSGLRTAVDELRAELDRHRDRGQTARVAAAADPVPCLDDQDRSAGARELGSRGKAGGAGADYEDISLNLRTSQGTITISAVSASSEAEMGWVRNTEGSPWLMESARRNCVSASGPRIRPITAGPTGMSQRRMANPSRPNT